MKTIIALITLALITVPGIAIDSRDGSNGVPFLAPDPSLKTTDRFIANLGGQYIGEVSPTYQLPAIFGGPVVAANQTKDDWMNLTEHNKKMKNEGIILIGSSFDMTEDQLTRAGVELGDEAWL